MRVGIFAKTFTGRAPLTVLQSVRAAGYSCCQYNMACSGLASLPTEISPDVADTLQRAVDETGVAISALSATYNMAHPDLAVRAKGRESLRALCAFAKTLGIPLVTLCTGSRNPIDQWADHPDNRSEETWFQLCEEFEFAISCADQCGVDLGIEPEPGNVVHDAERARALIVEMASERIRIVFDPANLVEGYETSEIDQVVRTSFDLLQDRISLVHAKDRSADGKVVAAGRGVVNFERLFAQVKGSGFTCDVVTHGLNADEAAEVSRFLKSTALTSGLEMS